MSFEIVRYEPRLLGQVAALQTRLWSPDEELNAAYFHWKHELNPFVRGPQVFLAMDRGRAVAMRGFVGSQWEFGAPRSTVALPLADDNVVAEGHEHLGVMRVLMSHALQELATMGSPCVINLTASPVTLMSSLATGWRTTAPLGAMRTTGIQSLAVRGRDLLSRIPYLWRWHLDKHPLFDVHDERRPYATLDREGPARLRQISQHLTIEREPRIDAMARLIERIGHDGRIRQVRDRRWLAWRFANPLATYRFIYWDERELEGYVVLEKKRSRHADRLLMSVVDCEGSSVQCQEHLLQAVVAAVPTAPYLAWRHGLPGAVGSQLEAIGFRPHLPMGAMANQRPCVLIKPLQQDAADTYSVGGRHMLDLSNWDLRPVYAC